MDQEIIDLIEKNRIDLKKIESWTKLLQINMEQVIGTELAKFSPYNLYLLEKIDLSDVKSVLKTISPEKKVHS
jgi:hypothetical protein